MKKLNFLVILTVILNAVIVIGAGHGWGILLIFEVLSPKFILTEGIHFNKFDSYDGRLLPVAFLSLIFQILLLISLKVKVWKLQKILIHTSCIALILVFFVLIKDFSESSLDKLSLLGGIPFLISSVFLLIKINFLVKFQ
ncbi:hypothetical protein ABEG63_20770 [Chryseobacterium sp. C39-AII1]